MDTSTLDDEASLRLVHEFWQAWHAQGRLYLQLEAASRSGDADEDRPRVH